MPRALVVRTPMDAKRFASLDAASDLILVESGAADSNDQDLVGRIAARRSMLIGFGSGSVGPAAGAVMLLSDFLVIDEDCTLNLDLRQSPTVAGAAAWRIGDRARRLLLSGRETLTASELLDGGIADALVARGEDSLKWLRSWIGSRSLPALASGAGLIRSSRPDVAERGEFARLFATGEPQHGLKKFLEKQPAGFEAALHLEIV